MAETSDEPQSWRAWPVITMIPADQVRPPEARRAGRAARPDGRADREAHHRSASDVIGGDGKVRVLSHRCGTCLFRRDHPFGADRATSS